MIDIEEGGFEIPLALKAAHGIQVDPEEGDVPVGPGESEDPGKAEDPGNVKTVSAEKAEVVAHGSAKSVSPKTGDSALLLQRCPCLLRSALRSLRSADAKTSCFFPK